MVDPSLTLMELMTIRASVHATCPNEHEYKLDLNKLADLVTPFAQLDEVVLTKSWCPHCGELAADFSIATTQ
jgi:hypothetical protein